MIGYFERNIRKRNADESKNKHKKKAYRRKEHEDARRERTMKLRQFYEFFSLMFDQKLFVPFSQFLTDESLRDLQKILKNRIKQKPSSGRESSIGKFF